MLFLGPLRATETSSSTSHNTRSYEQGNRRFQQPEGSKLLFGQRTTGFAQPLGSYVEVNVRLFQHACRLLYSKRKINQSWSYSGEVS